MPKRVLSDLSPVNQGFAGQSSRVETGLWSAASFRNLPAVRGVLEEANSPLNTIRCNAGDCALFPASACFFCLEFAFARGV